MYFIIDNLDAKEKVRVWTMAKFKAKTSGCQLIVKVRLSLSEKLDENELNNFSRKYVRGLLKVNKINKNKIEFLGPVGISLYERLKKPISKYDFFFIMEQFADLSRKMTQMQLTVNRIIFDIKNIYINEQTKELQFIYLPLQETQNVDLLDSMYNIIYSVKPIAEQDENYVSRFTYFLRGLSRFEPDKIESYIVKEDETVVKIITRHVTGQSEFMTDKRQDYYEYYAEKREDEATGLLIDDELTGLLVDEEETGQLFGEAYSRYATLYRILTDETIQIDKPVFRLGKERSYSDYFVSNNDAVSRSHADIITRGHQYFIMDLNSKNKTFLNRTPIIPRQEVELHEGDSIELGNEGFVFHV